ncbi:MAG: hypothetical protein JW852_02965, partial [Spirochaetales bacterium]|nr:hypothetical protein [Spirochaetales bacterium]
ASWKLPPMCMCLAMAYSSVLVERFNNAGSPLETSGGQTVKLHPGKMDRFSYDITKGFFPANALPHGDLP